MSGRTAAPKFRDMEPLITRKLPERSQMPTPFLSALRIADMVLPSIADRPSASVNALLIPSE